MVELVLAFDEKDNTLGDFISDCKFQLDIFLTENSIKYKALNSNSLNDLAITLTTKDLASFIFGAYSHGAKNCLLKSASTSYVSIEQNG